MFALLGSKIQAGAGQGGDREIDAFRLGICTRLFNLWPLGLDHLSVWKASRFDWKLLSVWRRGETVLLVGAKGLGEHLSAPQGLARDWTVVQLGSLVIGALGSSPDSR